MAELKFEVPEGAVEGLFSQPGDKRLRTTNMVERFNQELKRKSRLVRVWPNAESRERVYGALLMEQNEAWTGQVWVHMRGPA